MRIKKLVKELNNITFFIKVRVGHEKERVGTLVHKEILRNQEKLLLS